MNKVDPKLLARSDHDRQWVIEEIARINNVSIKEATHLYNRDLDRLKNQR